MSDIDEFKQVSNECLRLNYNGNFDESKLKIENFLRKHEFPYGDSEHEYHFFNNFSEQLLFEGLFSPKKEVIIINEDFCQVFYTYAHILFSIGQYSKSKFFLKLSYDLNPTDVYRLFELAKIYDIEYNRKMVEKTLKMALTIAHDDYDLFKAYQHLSRYYNQIGESEISTLLNSLKNEDSFKDVDKQYMVDLFKKYDLPLGFSSEVINAMEYAYFQAGNRASFEESYDLYYNYYDLCEFNEKFFK